MQNLERKIVKTGLFFIHSSKEYEKHQKSGLQISSEIVNLHLEDMFVSFFSFSYTEMVFFQGMLKETFLKIFFHVPTFRKYGGLRSSLKLLTFTTNLSEFKLTW